MIQQKKKSLSDLIIRKDYCRLNDKHITIVNDDSRVISK